MYQYHVQYSHVSTAPFLSCLENKLVDVLGDSLRPLKKMYFLQALLSSACLVLHCLRPPCSIALLPTLPILINLIFFVFHVPNSKHILNYC